MKSLLLITEGFPYEDSEQAFIATEFRYLMNNFDVHIMANTHGSGAPYRGPDDISHEEYEQKADFINILQVFMLSEFWGELRNALSSVHGVRIRVKRFIQIFGYAAHAKFLMKRMREVIEEYSVDVIYTYWCVPATLAALLLKKEFPSLKIVTRMHGYDLYKERTDTGWQPYRDMMSCKIDRFYFVSAYGKSYFQEHWGKINGGVFYLGSPEHGYIDNDYEGKFVLISCSNLIGLKRVQLIIEALAIISDECKIEWHHIGEGNMRDELELEASRLLLNRKNIMYKFEGRMDNNKIFPFYRRIRPYLFITTSSTEGGAPISVVEALSMGIPAIGTMVGGIPEIVLDGETGILLSADPDKEEIAGAIENFYRMSSSEKMHMSQNARSFWQKRLDADKRAECLIHELHMLVGDDKLDIQ